MDLRARGFAFGDTCEAAESFDGAAHLVYQVYDGRWSMSGVRCQVYDEGGSHAPVSCEL